MPETIVLMPLHKLLIRQAHVHKLCHVQLRSGILYFSQQGEGRERTLDTIASHDESVLLVVQNLDFLLIGRKTKESFKVVQDSFQHFSRLIIRF